MDLNFILPDFLLVFVFFITLKTFFISLFNMPALEKVAIIGSGNWGSAIAKIVGTTQSVTS